jgi:hypothetical protein
VLAGSESQSLSTMAQTDSEIILATSESPLHQTPDSPQKVEEAYISTGQEDVEKEKEREITYSAWDASRSVLPP